MNKFLRNKNTLSEKLLDEIVMLDLELGKYFALNPVASRVWELLEKPNSIEELCKSLLNEYQVEEEQCKKEVEALLEQLVKLKLIEKVD